MGVLTGRPAPVPLPRAAPPLELGTRVTGPQIENTGESERPAPGSHPAPADGKPACGGRRNGSRPLHAVPDAPQAESVLPRRRARPEGPVVPRRAGGPQGSPRLRLVAGAGRAAADGPGERAEPSCPAVLVRACRPVTVRLPAEKPAAGVKGVTARRRSGAVRLTRRGRIVVAVLLAALAVLTVGLTAVAQAQAASSRSSAAAVRRSVTRVVVMPGQTLWSIALRADPAADPRVVVQQIVDVNGLRTTALQPGEQLWVPRG